MDPLLGLVMVLVGLAWIAFPLVAFVVAIRGRSELHRLRNRLDDLEAEVETARRKAAAAPAVAPTLPTTPTLPATPVPALPATPVPAAAPVAEAPPAPEAAPVEAPTPDLVPTPVFAAASTVPVPEDVRPPSRKGLDSEGLEQLIGGIWLQNVGSVLLLLGTFFLILWGYTKGRIGPEILIAAGVALGGVVAWRGDRIARTLRPLGHALLGVGLGVVYITLYLGHFRMHVLSEWVTFVLLSLLSFLTVDIGLRRRQAVIASLGVAGAFIPLLASSMSGPGFTLTPSALLGYFAVVNAVVFALTAARGWSGLVLMALVLTSLTWAMHTRGVAWGFPVQLGLSTLFTALGMAPVIRFVRSPAPVRGVDLAVVAAAPMLFLIGTLSYFAARKGVTTGGLLAALGLVNLIVALWVDSRRSERDLWRPLTAAATIYLAAALERLVANEYLALAWCVEGAALVWLGIAPRGGWIRGLGYGVSALALLRLLIVPTSYDPAGVGGIGIVNGAALRDLLCILAFLVVSDRIGRSRGSLPEGERYVPGVWVIATTALIMIWFYREAPYLARWISGPGAPVAAGVPSPAPVAPRTPAVDTRLVVAVAWIVHSLTLVLLASVRRAPILRHVGYGVATVGYLALIWAISDGHYWKGGDLPVLYPAGILSLLGIAALLAMGMHLWSRRSTLGRDEDRSPEITWAAANVTLLIWTGREAAHAATAMGSQPGMILPLLAFLWSMHAAVLVLLSATLKAPILRYLGYGVGVLAFLVGVGAGDYWKQGDMAALYPAGLLTLFSVVGLMGIAAFLWSRRSTLGTLERRAPEVALIIANVALLVWTAREAAHMASAISPAVALGGNPAETTGMLAAGITSGAWVLQAGVLLAIGWARGFAFFRWMGLGLVGLTLSKFVFFDLQQVDVFWRFVIALGVGVVLLVLSFIYQRRSRRATAA